MTAAVWVLTRAALLAAVWIWDADDDVTAIAAGWARELLAGESPYHEVAVAYPPLAMFGFAVPALLPLSYALSFAIGMLVLDAVGARWGGLRYVLAVPALGPVLLLWRYDLAPAVLHLGAAVYALRGRRDLSWLLLGVGVALKPYLLVVVPLWLLWDRRPSRLAVVLAPSVVSALVMTALIGTEWVDAYAFQGSRELSVEAGPAVVAGVFGIGSVGLDRACLCFVRHGADSFGVAGVVLCVAALGTVYWRFRDRPVEGSLAAVAVVLLFAPVFSPQYLVWLLPVAALAGGRTLALAAAAAFTGFLAYPLLYDEVLAGDAFPLLIVRLILLAALVPFPPQGGEKHPTAPKGVHEQQSGAG